MFAARDLLILQYMDYRNGHALACPASGIGSSRGYNEKSICTIGMTFEQLSKTWGLKKKGKSEDRG